MTDSQLIEAAAIEIGAVIGALLDAPPGVTPGAAVDPGLIVRLALTGPVVGTLHVGMSRPDAATLAKLIMALDEDPPDSSVGDTLMEICGQAIGAMSQHQAFKGLRLTEARVQAAVPDGASTGFGISAGERFTSALCFWSANAFAESREPAPGAGHGPEAASHPNLDVILDIDLPLSVRFGETEMTLLALTRLAPGSVIDLGRSPDDPVDVLVNGRLIARAEVVVVSGNYGVRIIEVLSAADRLRTVAA